MRLTPPEPAPSRNPRGPLVITLLTGVLLAALLLTGCASSTASPGGTGDAIAPPTVPPVPDLTTPLTAVRSYLDWTAFSYRMANSDIASPTLSPAEGVHVDSYIQLNREKNRAIEQTLTSYAPVEVSRSSTSAVVAAVETWRYRYFTLDTQRYVSDWFTTTYDATYTVTAANGAWYVDGVEADPRTPVQ